MLMKFFPENFIDLELSVISILANRETALQSDFNNVESVQNKEKWAKNGIWRDVKTDREEYL